MSKRRIIVDFDGTICGFAFPACGPPEPGVKEALLELHDLGFEIIIHSCRTNIYWKGAKKDVDNRVHHIATITRYMDDHDLYYDELLIDTDHNKPFADFYIDDRGVSYKGNWPDVVNEIKIERMTNGSGRSNELFDDAQFLQKQ